MSYARHSRTPLTIYCMSLHGEFMCDKEDKHKGFHVQDEKYFWACEKKNCDKAFHIMDERGVPLK